MTVGATVAWRYESSGWVVRLDSPHFDPIEASADDAFEALCVVRDTLEPLGWRVGVVGAQADVWPSGMGRDQGGGLTSYRMTTDGAAGIVDTFEPVDPATVTTVAEQRTEIDRLYDESQRGT
ncbi:hypothetical protein [Marisediminicola sp. LYQ134]|uniref:hypothetical protein n=1 Tax=Marisediminicola sp. LYQ134 TaxID=3391061 RepID=UPI0039834C38